MTDMAKKSFLSGYKTYDASKGFGDAKQWKEKFNERMTSEQAARIMAEKNDSPYVVLGLNEHTATDDDIKSAYRTLMKRWHPDKNTDNQQEAEKQSKRIIAAYTILTANKVGN